MSFLIFHISFRFLQIPIPQQPKTQNNEDPACAQILIQVSNYSNYAVSSLSVVKV